MKDDEAPAEQSTLERLVGAVATVVFTAKLLAYTFVLLILFGGEPDLVDGAVDVLGAFAQWLRS